MKTTTQTATATADVTPEDRFQQKCMEALAYKKDLDDCRYKLDMQIKLTSNYRLALIRTIDAIQ